jgi:hypothetical protein
MSDFKFEINIDQLTAHLKDIKDEAQNMLTEAVKAASAMTYAKAQELAGEKLDARLKMYKDALHYKEVGPGLWVVELDDKALWIEENRPPHSMVDDLLRSDPKISKKGKRYKAIPFDQADSARQESNDNMQNIAKLLKTELKARGIPYKKIETNPDGTPKLGKLHKLNIESPKPTKMASHQALAGVTIYQRMTARGKVKRDILTFRIVTDDHKRSGKWFHPGSQGVKIFDEIFTWISNEWDTNILPSILKSFDK